MPQRMVVVGRGFGWLIEMASELQVKSSADLVRTGSAEFVSGWSGLGGGGWSVSEYAGLLCRFFGAV